MILNFIFSGKHIAAIELTVLNDISEMAKSKKIMLKVCFSPSEKLVYREMLRFSSNNQKINLRYWKASAAAKSEYVVPFHQPKRVFTEPFGLELTFEPVGVDDSGLLAVLAQTSVGVSYVSLEQRQKHNAQTAFVNLAGLNSSGGCQDQQEALLSGSSALEVQLAHVLSGSVQAPVNDSVFIEPIIDEEIFYLKRGEVFCKQVSRLMRCMLDAWGLIFILLVFFLSGLLVLIRWLLGKHPQALHYYPSMFANGVFIVFPVACIGVIGLCGAAGFAFIALGIYCLLLGSYILIAQQSLQDFKTKSLGFIGSVLVTSALPLVVKGLLLFVS